MTTKVNWYQASAEVALILAGVIIALAVDSWWTERQNRESELAYLQALMTDFQDNRQTLLDEIEVQKQIVAVGERILQLIEGGLSSEGEMAFFDQLDDLYYFREWAPITGTYDDLVGSGNLLLIENLEIRKELSAFQRDLSSIREFEGLQTETYYQNQAPFVLKYWDGTEAFWRDHAQWLGRQKAPTSPFPASFEPFATAEFWNLVVAWMWVHADIISSYEDAIAACDRIVGLIETELSAKDRE